MASQPPDDGHGWLLNNSTDADNVERYYDEWAGHYDDELRAWNYRSPDEAARLLAGYAPPDARVLDAGCGTGLSGHALLAAGFRDIVGIDLSTESLRIAAEREVYKELLQVNLQQLPMPFADDSFDALTCVGVLTYVADMHGVLEEFCRVVRPGGHLVLTCRDDLYETRNYAGEFDALSERGTWRTLYQSPPSPYLPGNDDFADQIRVIYLVTEVLG